MPFIVQVSPSGTSLKSLEIGLGIGRTQAEAILKKEPSLSRLSALEAKLRLDNLSRHLAPKFGPGLKPAVESVLRQPRLLTFTPEEIDLRVKALGALLRSTPAVIADMIHRQPGLATHTPTTLALRLKGVGELLEVTDNTADGGRRGGAALLVEMEPGLLCFRHQDLDSRLNVRSVPR